MTKQIPNTPYNPYESGLPTTNNNQIWDKKGAPVAPAANVKPPTPSKPAAGTGTPMDKSPTICPR